jgi:hypothetical protein
MQNDVFNATEKVLLYYPTIDIPSLSWIRQGLLYWDKIGSIVPQSYVRGSPRNSRYSEQIQPIYDAGLFRPYDPENLIRVDMSQGNLLQSFKREVLKTLRSRDFKRPQKRKNIFDTPLYPEKIFDTPLYSEKVFGSLHKELVDKYAEKRDDGFFYFEKNTAFVYMTILAKYLADIDDQFTVPSTDDRSFERVNFKATEKDDYSNPCLRIEFRNILRVPADDVKIERVIDFRQKHNDKLLNFRRQVLDKFEDEIKKSTERREIQDKTIRFKSQIESGVRELNQVLGEARFQTFTGTLKSIIKPQHLTAALAVGTATTVATGVAPIGVIAGLASGAAVEVYDYFVSRKNAKRDRLRANAYSYLYLAEKEFESKTDLISLNLSK